MTNNIIALVCGAFLFAFGVFLGVNAAEGVVTEDCAAFSKFRIKTVVFECRRVTP